MPVTTLIVIRHAIAENRAHFSARTQAPDTDRPLTAKGRLRMAEGCIGLRRLVPSLGILASSPWTRALQTADIVANAYGAMNITRTDALIPDRDPEQLLLWLRHHHHNGPVAVIGHEPHLGDWVGWAINGAFGSPLPLKKGGACALRFDDKMAPGSARLVWFMAPRELRRLSGYRLEKGVGGKY